MEMHFLFTPWFFTLPSFYAPIVARGYAVVGVHREVPQAF